MILYQGDSPRDWASNSLGDCTLTDRHWHLPALPEDLRTLRTQALRYNAQSISSPVATADQVELAWTEMTLAETSQQVRRVQFCLEPVTYYVSTVPYLHLATSEITEAEFVARLLTRTGCGWRVNLTHLHANSANFSFDPYEFLAEVLPVAPHVQLELTGGHFDGATRLQLCDAEYPIPPAAWELYRFARTQARRKLAADFAPTRSNPEPLRGTFAPRFGICN